MSPRVSVVVPTYNRADLISETLESILAQSLPPAEVIVVDDGSLDDTPARLAAFGSRIRAIRIANSGELVARNHGIRAASGDLIAFCDSDDLWRPDHLASMARIWLAEPTTRAAYANFRIVRDGRWSERDKFADAPPGYWEELEHPAEGIALIRTSWFGRLVAFMPFFPSAFVVRRDVFQGMGGWDEAVNRQVSMDIATTFRIADIPPVGLVTAPTVGIRKHAGNFSADIQAMNLGDAAMLEYLLRSYPPAAAHAGAIGRSVAERRIAALAVAFARQDFGAVSNIRALLGNASMPAAARLKSLIANLPRPVAHGIAGAALGFGSLKASLIAAGRSEKA